MIFRTLIWVALAVAVLVGSVQLGLQQLQTLPIILAAEKFESQKLEAPEPPVAATHAHSAEHDYVAVTEEWVPTDGLERQFWTWVANVLHAFSMALLVLAAMAVCQWRGSTIRTFPLAALVAAAGWLSFHFWPSLGLHAEIPGMDAARLGSRQGWWALAAGGAAFACMSLALMRSPLRFVAAVGLLALPFLIGAPQIVADPLSGFTGEAQLALRQLGTEFIWATHWLSLSFWGSIGVATGLVFQRWLRPAMEASSSASGATPAPGPEGLR